MYITDATIAKTIHTLHSIVAYWNIYRPIFGRSQQLNLEWAHFLRKHLSTFDNDTCESRVLAWLKHSARCIIVGRKPHSKNKHCSQKQRNNSEQTINAWIVQNHQHCNSSHQWNAETIPKSTSSNDNDLLLIHFWCIDAKGNALSTCDSLFLSSTLCTTSTGSCKKRIAALTRAHSPVTLSTIYLSSVKLCSRENPSMLWQCNKQLYNNYVVGLTEATKLLRATHIDSLPMRRFSTTEALTQLALVYAICSLMGLFSIVKTSLQWSNPTMLQSIRIWIVGIKTLIHCFVFGRWHRKHKDLQRKDKYYHI